jgi:metal transporter CNNM
VQNNVVGLLLVKDLIFVDPEDETRVADFVQIFGRKLGQVWPDDKLGDVLRELKTGRAHMALVRDVNNEDDSQDPFYEIIGIITMEDIIEEILGEEIVDETDAFVDGTHAQRVDRTETFEWARLRLLDSKIVDERLSRDETMAVTAHLSRNFPNAVTLLTDNQLHRLIAETPISILPTAVQEIGEKLPTDLVYEKGVPSDVCTLILSGKVTVLVGTDGFRSDVSSWCLLGVKSLSDSFYKPDFNAFVSSGPCRCLRITRARFDAAVDASTTERHSHHKAAGISPPLQVSITGHPVPSESSPTHGSDAPKDDRYRKGQLLAALQIASRGSGAHVTPASGSTSAVNSQTSQIPSQGADSETEHEGSEPEPENKSDAQNDSQNEK